MPSSPEQDAQVAKDLNKKLRLETAFRPAVRNVFARMLRDFRVTVAATGFAPEASKYKADWESNLKRHYERVQRAFSGVVLEQQKSCNPTWETKQEDGDQSEAEKIALFGLALQQWKERNAGESATFITETSQRQFNEALREARQVIEEQRLGTDRRTLALTAAVILRRKFAGRTNTIVMFETQKAAESTKLTEAEVMADLQPSVLSGVTAQAGVTATKTWRSVGDSKVRASHTAVNFQLRKINEPFSVMGQLLMHPGDTSLGATAENVANCRCSSQFRI